MNLTPGLFLSYTQLQELVNYAKTSPNKEICGAIIGTVVNQEKGIYKMIKFIPIKNVAEEGVADYIMDGNELLNKVLINSQLHMNPKSALSFIGVFHNHPWWRPIPSEMDIQGAGYAGIYIIYSNLYDDLMAWYNEGSDDPKISTAMHQENVGFGNACLYLK